MHATTPPTTCRILALQKITRATPAQNMAEVSNLLAQTGAGEVDFIVLPEIFICPYDNSKFPVFAQEEGGEAYSFLARLAAEKNAYVIGGSIPEREGDKIYNTSFVFDRNGRKIGRHRKIHLFDIDIEGGQYFKESDVLSPGKDITVFNTEFGRMGVGICFDIRFPDLFSAMRRQGIVMAFVPAAFNMTTGPAHWETLFKARALDNQIYMLGCAPARDEGASYVSYGHSILTDPWGSVVRELGFGEGMLLETVDLTRVARIRKQIPIAEKVPDYYLP